MIALALGAVLGGAALGGCGAGEQADAGVSCYSEGPPAHVGGTWILSGKGKRSNCSDHSLNDDFELGPAQFEIVMEDPNQYDGGLPQDAGGDAAPQADARTDGHPEAGADAGSDAGSDAGDDAGPGDDGPTDGGGDGGDAGAADGGVDAGDAAAQTDGGLTDAPADAAPQADAQVDAPPPIVYQPATLRLESSIPDFGLTGEVRGECVSFDTAEVIPDLGNVTYSFRGDYESFGRRVEGTFTGKGPGGNCTTRGTFTVELQ
jgi:hypothetical protein